MLLHYRYVRTGSVAAYSSCTDRVMILKYHGTTSTATAPSVTWIDARTRVFSSTTLPTARSAVGNVVLLSWYMLCCIYMVLVASLPTHSMTVGSTVRMLLYVHARTRVRTVACVQ